MAEPIGRTGPEGPAGGAASSGGLGAGCETDAEAGKDAMAEASTEVVTLQELRDFLEADRESVPADPVFKERLREKLWSLLQRRRRAQRGEDA